jgi:hypothetical protein
VTAILLSGRLAEETGERGDSLFHGREKMNGKIRGHNDTLPPETVRCANCHEAADKSRLSRVAAPRLDRSVLLALRPRRGGPPSRYDRPAFCKLLRTGIDPVNIVIAREMPVYEVAEAQCASLWTFLLGKEDADAKR